MKNTLKKQKGITLIALIVTIIVMLILSGITINLIIGQDGIINRAQEAGVEHEKARLKEELELAILDLKTNKLSQEQSMKREDLMELEKIGAIMESTGIPAEGEYKDYYFEIDEDYVVTIIGKVKGEKPTIQAQIVTDGIIVQGEKVYIKVTATISQGTIEKIEAINGAILIEDISSTEKIFEVNNNGIYYFKVKAENGRTAIANINVMLNEELGKVYLNNGKYTGDLEYLQFEEDKIIINSVSGWEGKSIYLEDLPLKEYSKIKITYSFDAGYDWGICVYNESEEEILDGSNYWGHGTSVPKTTRIFDLPNDKEYTGLRFASSSLSAKLNIYEIYLIK